MLYTLLLAFSIVLSPIHLPSYVVINTTLPVIEKPTATPKVEIRIERNLVEKINQEMLAQRLIETSA